MNKTILWSFLLFFSGNQTSRTTDQKNAEFAVDLYKAISLSHKNNIIFSPLGTTVLLGMVQLGAKGKAQQQILRTLRMQETSAGEEFSVLKSLFSAISKKKQEFTFNLASALYLQEGFIVKEMYLHSNKEFFQSATKLVDFLDAKTSAQAISTWVESKTDGKIKDMFSEEDFGPLTRLVLVNAIYFKGDWKQKFIKEDTEMTDFSKKDGSTVKVPMMKALLRAKYGYFSESSMTCQVLELPYKADEFSLVIILPTKGVNIEEVEKQVTAHHIRRWFSELREEEVEVSLPRFKIEQKLDFKEALYSLNVTEIFSGGCDLSGITDSSEVYVSRVMQKVFFEINEDGSEAAASAGINIPAIMSLTQTQFLANHPFLFIMKHIQTESILFMGKVTDPDIQTMKGRDLDSL
ncbi:serpin I2 [Apodemus sylvaticus]|uniref:serpin I2 n=1 Tax=Apodemus sylvaticus TaxID=10129 RepID=UPI002242FF3A|nr:serpin I2 [Apodemus sylvaticus]XP_052036313.1 serpin I2 [Apodemus sylvaticus]XP_052036314.1 serpin I2 [Apodemus sylvaticus]XP_052036315.1 serpin I2 [Apodemus sylvaticus]